MIDDGASDGPSLKERIKRRRETRDDEADFVLAPDAQSGDYSFGAIGWAVALDEGNVAGNAPDEYAETDETDSEGDTENEDEDEGDPTPASFEDLSASVEAMVSQTPRLRERLRGRVASPAATDAPDDAPATDGEASPQPEAAAPIPDVDDDEFEAEEHLAAVEDTDDAPSEAAAPVESPAPPHQAPPAPEIPAAPAIAPGASFAPTMAEPASSAAAPPPKPTRRDDRPIIAAPLSPRRFARTETRITETPEEPASGRGSRRSRRERAKREDDGALLRAAERIEGGGTVMISDVLHPLHDWSTGGLAIAADGQRWRVGDRALLEVEFDLGDHAVNIDLPGEVMNRSSDRIGWRFVGTTARQDEVLRQVALASLSGRPFAAPSQDAGRGRRSESPRAPRRRRGLGAAGALIALVFNAAVILFIAGAILLALGRGDVMRLIAPADAPAPEVFIRADHAALAVETLPLVAGVGGIVLEWGAAPGAEVDNGEALVSLALDEGEAADRDVVASPCDCILARVLTRVGTRVASGETLALLYPRGSTGYVQALFNPARAPAAGAAVTVTAPDTETQYQGRVTAVGMPEDPGSDIGLPKSIILQGDTFVRIETTPPVPAALAGEPVVVTVTPPEDD